MLRWRKIAGSFVVVEGDPAGMVIAGLDGYHGSICPLGVDSVHRYRFGGG